MTEVVRDNPEAHRFELPIADDAIAAAYYRQEGETVVLIHTEVPSEYMGAGIASRLAAGVFDRLRASGRKVIPSCEFMRRYVVAHPETRDIVVG